jgi:hypothetical protein
MTATARDRLLHIAIVIQRDIIQSLELAAKYENVVLDLPDLREIAMMNRKNTIDTLSELKHRALLENPLQRTIFTAPRISRNSRGSIVSVLPSRSPGFDNKSPISVEGDPAAKNWIEEKFGLARNFSVQREDTEPSIPSSRSSFLASESVSFHPALSYLLRGKSLDERKVVMNDIDELIAAYQNLTNLAVDNDRAAALASLTGQSDAVKRDTLATLLAKGKGKGPAALNYDALEMLKKLPPTPGEGQSQYFSYNDDIQNPNDDKGPGVWPNIPQPPTPVVSRWSTASSTCSDHTIMSENPPSLCRYGSMSSHGSDTLPAEPPSPTQQHIFNSASPQHPNLALWGMDHMHTQKAPSPPLLRPDSLAVAPLSIRSRPTTPTNESRAALLNKPLPPIKDHPATHYENSKRVHLDANDDYFRNAMSGPLQPSSRPITPSSRPLTPLSRPITPLSRPITPLSRPITPLHRPISPCVVTTITTPAQEKMMGSKPSKENNYWGFCKGAWAVAEDTKKGLGLEIRPTGMYSVSQVWQCKHCCFEGSSVTIAHPSKKNKKKTVVNPYIYKSSVGIRYRWIFLAKSHVRQVTPSKQPIRLGDKDSDCSFGCTICSAEKSVTSVFGNVETLMNHIFMEHARPGRMRSAVLKSTKCIFGRTAGADEDWDLNIPNQDTCVMLF